MLSSLAIFFLIFGPFAKAEFNLNCGSHVISIDNNEKVTLFEKFGCSDKPLIHFVSKDCYEVGLINCIGGVVSKERLIVKGSFSFDLKNIFGSDFFKLCKSYGGEPKLVKISQNRKDFVNNSLCFFNKHNTFFDQDSFHSYLKQLVDQN